MADKDKTILIAEANEDEVFFMQRTLRECAWPGQLRFATNGKEAIDYL
jgi:hypothetical protein